MGLDYVVQSGNRAQPRGGAGRDVDYGALMTPKTHLYIFGTGKPDARLPPWGRGRGADKSFHLFSIAVNVDNRARCLVFQTFGPHEHARWEFGNRTPGAGRWHVFGGQAGGKVWRSPRRVTDIFSWWTA